jgi:Tol biopolymer transport system component
MRLGPYEVLAHIGVGGMGEVYRATDTKLKRQVALKILPTSLATDPDRLARFQREAEVLASLNHPNIAAIYGLEDADGIKALVMELVEGPTLADRIAHGVVPFDEALPIAKQIAEALEAAHEKGIIHRDLKPANIKVRSDGTVKVLDFGLAKAMEPTSALHASSGQALSQSPTITTPAMTQVGIILGTAAYMSPEQARGKPVDNRADIWAFGCVLYEMLTGRRPFGGDTVTETLAAILERPVDWTTLPTSTPQGVRTVLRHALEKDPRRRLHDIADARIQLDDNLLAPPPVSGATRNVTRRWIMALGATALVSGGAVWYLGSTRPSTVPIGAAVTRLVVTPEGPFPTDAEGVVALSPDGRRLAYVATPDGQPRLYLREIDQFEGKPVPGTEGAVDPAFSPDGNWIAFAAAGKIKKVTVTGDRLATLTEAQPDRNLFLSWESNDSLFFIPGRSTGVWRVSAAGGSPTPVTTLQEGELEHQHPAILPDGKSLLYSVRGGLGSGSTVIAQSLETGQRTNLGPGGVARYLSTGHLVYVQAGSLFAVPFDAVRLEVRGSPTAVLQGIRETEQGIAQIAFSQTGAIAYVPTDRAERQSALVWVDRAGVEQATFATGLDFSRPRLAPDGRRVAVAIGSGAGQAQNLGDLWVFDLTREIRNRLTFDGRSTFPTWSPDGSRLAYSSDRGDGRYQLHLRGFSAGGSDEEIPTNRGTNYPFSWSPDSRFVATVSVAPTTANDIWVLPVDDPAQWRPFVRTPLGEGAPTFSPDGRWIAYVSEQSGRSEIYMRPFPGPGEEVTISTDGGNEPIWARKTGDLFYRRGNSVIVVAITTTPTVSVGRPRQLFERAYSRSNAFWPNYDVSPDGQRLLMIKGIAQEAPKRINVVLNWVEELKRLMPTK